MYFLKNNFIIRQYSNFLIKYPLAGTALTSGAGMGVGNVLCQTIMYHKEKKFEVFKVAQYSMFGLLISGPFLRYWWHYLELGLFKNPNTFIRPVKMMLVDQATTPWILNGSFLYYLAITDGNSYSESFEALKNKLFPIVIASYKVWPLAMLVNFYVIPLHNRVLFSNVIAVLWTAYMAYLIPKK